MVFTQQRRQRMFTAMINPRLEIISVGDSVREELNPNASCLLQSPFKNLKITKKRIYVLGWYN